MGSVAHVAVVSVAVAHVAVAHVVVVRLINFVSVSLLIIFHRLANFWWIGKDSARRLHMAGTLRKCRSDHISAMATLWSMVDKSYSSTTAARTILVTDVNLFELMKTKMYANNFSEICQT